MSDDILLCNLIEDRYVIHSKNWMSSTNLEKPKEFNSKLYVGLKQILRRIIYISEITSGET